MLDTFLEWANSKITELTSYGFEGRLTIGEDCSNRSARLDIDTENSVARITFWNSGDVDLEVIDVDLERTIYSKQSHIAEAISLDREFHDFFAALGIRL
jgi:hypothetical protein